MTPPKTDFEGPLEQRPANGERVAADRRSRLRFSFRLAVTCRRVGPRFLLDRIIVGESLNISSKGLLFTANERFRPGQLVRAFIDWPIRLQSRVRLTFVAEGTVVRSAGNITAMAIKRYHFRTSAAGGVAGRKPNNGPVIRLPLD
jgi:hypothetical protein